MIQDRCRKGDKYVGNHCGKLSGGYKIDAGRGTSMSAITVGNCQGAELLSTPRYNLTPEPQFGSQVILNGKAEW